MPAFIFDLDGTLVDSVYQHVVAWHTALSSAGFRLPMWRIHRKIGMSGQLLMSALELEIGRNVDEQTAKRMEDVHTAELRKMDNSVQVFDGVKALFDTLDKADVRYAIATSGHLNDVSPFLDMLSLPKNVPIISAEDAANAKPDPQLFLKAAEKLRTDPQDCIVVGDSVWDMLAARRAHCLGVGLLTGGYSESEMTAAGAYRVYPEPGDLTPRLHEVGVNVKE